MLPDLYKEFKLLSDQARQQLKCVTEAKSYRHVYSLLTLPSFAPSSRCAVYSPRRSAKGKLPFADFSIWRSDLDLEKFETPLERLKHPKNLVPTIQRDVLWLTNGVVEQIEQRIRGISIPLYLGECAMDGLDGTMFEFCFDELLFGVTLHWWVDHPKEWRPFTEKVMQIAAELEDRRKRNTHSNSGTNNRPDNNA